MTATVTKDMEAVYAEHYQPLLRILRSRYPGVDPDYLEDCAQHAMVAYWEKAEHDGNIRSYLLTVAINKRLHTTNRPGKRSLIAMTGSLDGMLANDDGETGLERHIADSTNDPGETVPDADEREHLRRKVRRVLAKIKGGQYLLEAYALSDYNGQPLAVKYAVQKYRNHPETMGYPTWKQRAKAEGVPYTLYRQRVYYAKLRFKEEWGKEG